MRAVLNLLTTLCVLWCALGFCEPANAHTLSVTDVVVTSADPAQDLPGDAVDLDAGHHHHCPVAPDLATGPTVTPSLAQPVPLLATPVLPLASRSFRPPLQPPAA